MVYISRLVVNSQFSPVQCQSHVEQVMTAHKYFMVIVIVVTIIIMIIVIISTRNGCLLLPISPESFINRKDVTFSATC